MQQPCANGPLEELTLGELRRRKSIKWTHYPPDVLPLWVAEMDVRLAEPIRNALGAALDLGDTGYPNPSVMVDAFVGFADRRLGWKVDPGACRIAPTVLGGVRGVLAAVTRPGDGVVINSPMYHPFYNYIEHSKCRVVPCPLVPDVSGHWSLDLAALERTFADPAVSAYLLCSPHNPTGTVFRREELVAVAELAHRHGIRVLSDEVHAPLVYPDTKYTPFLTLVDGYGGAASAYAFTSASKAWNIPGLVAAIVVSGPEARDELRAIPSPYWDGVGQLGTLASMVAFTEGDGWLDEVLAGLDRNRRLLGELLADALPAVRYRPPDGTYLAWLDCRGLPGAGDDPAEVFRRVGRVAVSPGPQFGPEGRGHARVNFATSQELLREAVSRMARSFR